MLSTDFALLSGKHDEEIASVDKRIDAINNSLPDSLAETISKYGNQIAELEKRLDNI